MNLDEKILSNTEKTDRATVLLEGDEIDPRLKLLSYSSSLLLHKCPRKYELYKLGCGKREEDEYSLASISQRVTFSFGTTVGVGIQAILEDKPREEVILETFMSWKADLLEVNKKQKKSYWEAQSAVESFYSIYEKGVLKDYKLVYYKGKPAVELAFKIDMPDGFCYRGFIDAVLQNKKTGEIVVLEIKTTSGNTNTAMYKNSNQALGYSIILDALFPSKSSYIVLYLIYETRLYSFTPLAFEKTLLCRALWLQELLLDKALVELYERAGHYPKRGDTCYDFYRECEYFGICELSTDNLVKPLTKGVVAKIEKENATYLSFALNNLIKAQMVK